MVARICWTVAALVFAIAAFCGFGPGSAGLVNPFGFLFLIIALVIWRAWGVIVGDFSPPAFDGLTGNHVEASGSKHVVAEIYPERRPVTSGDHPRS
jgi:hypothetical protein